MNRPQPQLFLSDARGINIPKDFATGIDRKLLSNVSDEDITILTTGPDHEWYWEAWDTVCQNAKITGNDGVTYTIHQDGDCWLIPAGMEWSDDEMFFVYPSEDES